MNRPRATAYTATAVIALLTIVGLRNGSLEFDTRTLRVPPRPVTELVEIEDEEFVDIYNPSGNSANPAPAVAKENAHSRSTPASATGTDLSDAGKEAAAPVPPASEQESPVTAPEPHASPTGPDRDSREAEEARRRAEADTRSAFRNAAGKDNTSDRGKKSDREAGRPDGHESQANGTGMGTVGGGWHMPRYAKVPSTLTGSIVLRATVDRTGHVSSVIHSGGEAPAAADAALVRACIAEVRSRVFTRSDKDAPEQAIATITYRFR